MFVVFLRDDGCSALSVVNSAHIEIHQNLLAVYILKIALHNRHLLYHWYCKYTQFTFMYKVENLAEVAGSQLKVKEGNFGFSSSLVQ